jgi:hypothetical protein
MKAYPLSDSERASTGYTDLFVLELGDIPDNTTVAVTLTTLNIGDVVMPSNMLHEIKTYIAGPATCTVSVGVTGTLTQYTAASDVKSAANKYVTPALAVAIPRQTAVALVANIIAGSGACTAGEIYIWASIARANARDVAA